MKKYPILITIPHCSERIAPEVQRQLLPPTKDVLLNKTDFYTDKIFEVGNAHIVKALYSRAVLDLNRAADDFTELVVTKPVLGKPLYKTPPNQSEIVRRVRKYHRPFHKKIENRLSKVKFLIDGHSLWSQDQKTKKKRADIVLSNHDFLTCSRDATLMVADFLKSKGFSVAINDPFKGRYIVKHYCHFDRLPGLQMELNRKLYMNEKTLEPHPKKIKKLNKIITELVEMLAKKL